MKKLTSLAALLAIMALAVSANAQLPYAGADVGVFYDSNADAGILEFSTTAQLDPAFTSKSFWVVGQNLTEMAAYEFVISLSDPSVFAGITGENFPPGNLDIVSAPLVAQVGTGGCVGSSDQMVPTQTYDPMWWPLVRIDFLLIAPATDLVIALEGYTGAGGLGEPAYSICDAAGTLFAFGTASKGEGRYPDGALVINPTLEGPVGTEDSSFGSLKARY